jgi:hypothetical protein
MTIYGDDSRTAFKPRPHPLRVLLVSAAGFLIGLQIGIFVFSFTQVLASSVESNGARPIYAPFAQSPLLPPSPLAPLSAAAIPPAVTIVAALLIVFLWPAGDSLARRVSPYFVAMAFATVVTAVALESEPRRWLEADLSLLAIWRPLAAGAAVLVVLQSERRITQLLGNFYPVRTPLQRIRLWAMRIPLPVLVIAVAAWGGPYLPMAEAALALLLLTFLLAAASKPPDQFEAVSEYAMREASLIAPLAAIGVVALCLWTFGSPLLGDAPRAVMVGGSKFASFEGTASLKKTLRRDADIEIKRQEEEKKAKEPVIDIRWSKSKP